MFCRWLSSLKASREGQNGDSDGGERGNAHPSSQFPTRPHFHNDHGAGALRFQDGSRDTAGHGVKTSLRSHRAAEAQTAALESKSMEPSVRSRRPMRRMFQQPPLWAQGYWVVTDAYLPHFFSAGARARASRWPLQRKRSTD